MAKEDVAKILQKTNYSFAVQKLNFDDIYNSAIYVTQAQIIKILNRKKGFLFCKDNCEFKNLELIKKIIERIANNIKNLFDKRYKNCINKEVFCKTCDDDMLDYNDALTIMIFEENELELKALKNKLNAEYLECILPLLKIEKNESGNSQLCLNLEGDAA
ncbi:MAG: hypothetical protein RBT52_08045 [Sulfurimonas sp.]|nr:hypothetical protein [Sulfurimonas sp.]